MKIRTLEGLHLTATMKRHIAQMIRNGMTHAATKALRYQITDRAENIVRVTVNKRDVDAFGRMFWRRGEYTVEVQA